MKTSSLYFLTLIVFLNVTVVAEEYRTFTNNGGRSIKAKVKAVEGASAVIVLETGKEFTVQLNT